MPSMPPDKTRPRQAQRAGASMNWAPPNMRPSSCRFPPRLLSLQCLALLCLLLLAVSTCPAFAQERLLRVVGDENYPPYLFINAEGEADGFLADLWQRWSQVTGIPVDLQPLQWDLAQQRLLAGEADVIENLYKTPQRLPLYAFPSLTPPCRWPSIATARSAG